MRNYLAPIVGYTELLRECGALSEEGRLGVGRIMQGVSGLQRLVRQLTGFARPSGGELLPVALSPLIEEVIAFFQKDLTRQRISTELQMEPVPPVLADPGGLQQIFFNLVSNALQAMQGGGVLRVSARRGLEGVIEVSMEDTGRGIPADLLPRLFTPFFTTKPPGEGTGLGLFICRQITERMNGRIDVRSRPGEGATFILSLKPAESVPA
jgi:signal transduction histidine kinase